ncbi:MAG: patatin family protein [Lachnospiraceae bacterium]|nr:patatin family protein [Lachnospiraceae bacterium]MBR4412123.1 patatin family protein [Lachnospiraceae bacterium]MBR5917303.1 patatin family protein [Lachnospiraceae bacterium]
MKTGLILEGGGLRGSFSAGVLDVFIREGITFDYACGVSAGAGVLYNFIAGQEGRTKQVFLCPREHSYYGFRELCRSGHFMNLNKLYGEMAFEEPPFEFEKYFASETEVEVVATNCVTGKPEYLKDNGTIDSLFDCGRATGSLPFISGPYKIGDNYYMDGSVSDPVPIKRAIEKGCDRIIVVSTKAEGMNPSNMKKYLPAMKVKYPRFKGFRDSIRNRIPLLLGQYEMMEEMAKEGTVLIFQPEGHWDVSHMEKDIEKIHALYDEGVREANVRLEEVKKFISE